MRFIAYFLFFIGITAAGASDFVVEEKNQSIARPTEQSDILIHILSYTNRDTIANAKGVCTFWLRVVQDREFYRTLTHHIVPADVQLTDQNVSSWLQRLTLIPVTLFADKVFNSLENYNCALSAFVEHKAEADDFFKHLSRADFWRLTWPLQSKCITFQNDPALRATHKQVLTSLLSLSEIPALESHYEQIFNGEDNADLFYAFCVANDRRILFLQVIDRLNMIQKFHYNACILNNTPWDEEQRQQYFYPIENPQSIYQYVVQENDDGVLSVGMQYKKIDMDEFNTYHRIPMRWIHVPTNNLFEVTIENYDLLNPLIPFISLQSLHTLLDKKTISNLNQQIDVQYYEKENQQQLLVETVPQDASNDHGLELQQTNQNLKMIRDKLQQIINERENAKSKLNHTLYELRKERYLRTRDEEDLKFIQEYEKEKQQVPVQ